MGRDDEHTWAELVESFHASTDDADRTWPDAENLDSETSDGPPDSPATTTRPGLGQADTADRSGTADGAAADVDSAARADDGPAEPASRRSPERARADDEEHFVPPTPPPIPRTDMITMLAWFGVFGTPVLFAVAYVLGQSVSGLVSFIAVVAFIGGFAVLISRLRGHDPHDPDSGAVV